MSKSQFHVRQMCRIAVMAALYVPLALYVGVKVGNVHITFGSLPVVVAALLWGPGESFLVAAIGEFFTQLLNYGLTATTILYVIPPALRGVVIGVAAVWLWQHRGVHLECNRVLCYLVCIAAAVVTTTSNTVVIAVDSIIYGYYSAAYVFGTLLWRFAVGMINAVVISTVAMVLVSQVRLLGLEGKSYAGRRGH